MKKQKICIIGGGLAGLVTAICLSKLNCEIDLIVGKTKKNLNSNKTLAISESNLNFLKKMGITEVKKYLWSCEEIKLYTEVKNQKFNEVLEIKNQRKAEQTIHIAENSKILKLMINKVKKIKKISLKKNIKISNINDQGSLKSIKLNKKFETYNLIIICAGNNSDLVKNTFNKRVVENFYKETSIVTILNHSALKNKIARQIFLKDQILALLPISKTKTSIIWSVKKSIFEKNDLFLKNKIKYYSENFLKKVQLKKKLEFKSLNFLIRDKYFQNRTLLFGDALHIVHPFAGQGFNMILRDLECLENILRNKIDLGLDIGSKDILSEFSKKTKPRNFAFSISLDILKNAFSYNNKSFKIIRDETLKVINKSNTLKSILFDVANKGFKF